MADKKVLVDHLKPCRRQTVDLTIQHVYAVSTTKYIDSTAGANKKLDHDAKSQENRN